MSKYSQLVDTMLHMIMESTVDGDTFKKSSASYKKGKAALTKAVTEKAVDIFQQMDANAGDLRRAADEISFQEMHGDSSSMTTDHELSVDEPGDHEGDVGPDMMGAGLPQNGPDLHLPESIDEFDWGKIFEMDDMGDDMGNSMDVVDEDDEEDDMAAMHGEEGAEGEDEGFSDLDNNMGGSEDGSEEDDDGFTGMGGDDDGIEGDDMGGDDHGVGDDDDGFDFKFNFGDLGDEGEESADDMKGSMEPDEGNDMERMHESEDDEDDEDEGDEDDEDEGKPWEKKKD